MRRLALVLPLVAAALAGAALLVKRSDAPRAGTGIARVERPGPASGPEAGPRDGGTLRVHVEAEPSSLNPLVEHDAWTMWITLGAVYDPLLRQAGNGAFSPSLATAWATPDDHTVRLSLRPGVTWHDGRPFTADDVIATFDRLRDPSASPDARADFADLVSVEKAAPLEVVLRFSRPAPLVLQSLSHLAILPAHRFRPDDILGGDLRRAPASRAPVGTGPFRFVEWSAGDRIVLARSPSYWGARAHVERVELVVVRDRDAAFERFRRGQLDVLWQLTPSQVQRVTEDPSLAAGRMVAWHLPRYSFVVWNLARPGLGDRRVRQALSMLIDRRRYLDVAFHGRATAVTGPYPIESPSYDASIRPWPFDPARARALLDQAGVRDSDGDGVRDLDGKPLRLAFLLTAGSRTLEPLVTLMQDDFRRSGILLDVVPTEWAVLLDRLRKHDFDAAALQWVMQPIQDNYTLFHSTQAERGQNYGSFASPAADRLLEELRRSPPGAQRVQLDHAFHRLIHEEQPYTFLGSPEVDSWVSPRVRDFAPGAAGLGLAELWLSDGAATP